MISELHQALPWILGFIGLILAGESYLRFKRRRAQRRRLQAHLDAIMAGKWDRS